MSTTRHFLLSLAAALGFTGPALAQDVPSVVRQFGLIGTWSVDCGKPASDDNNKSTYAVAGAKVIRKDDRGPGADKPVDLQVRTAKIVGPDLLEVQERGIDMPEDMAAAWETTVVLRRDGPDKIRIWKSTMGGKTTVENGKVVGGGGETWAMSRCK